MKKYTVCILGGTDGFGAWLAEYALQHFSGHIVLHISGRKREKGELFCCGLEEKYGAEVSFYDDNILAVKGADIIVYSVPIAYTQEIISQTLPYIHSGAIVADVTSIKWFPSRTMKERDDIFVIPTHPMFGPYISSIAGQVVVLTADKASREKKEYVFLFDFLKSQKARVIESSTKEHDKMMAVVQWLTHLNMFVVGETMKRLDFNIAESMSFISPIYKLMVSSVGRYLGQNPWLYADIQMYNEEVLEVHEKFLDTAKNFHASVKNRDSAKFCQDILDARQVLGIENCQEGQEYTDKVIYMLGKQIDILKEKIGQKLCLKNIYSGELEEGILQKYENGQIFFSSGEVYKIDNYEVLES